MGKGKPVEADFDDSPSEKYGKRKPFDPDFHGPLRKRGCTDTVCLGVLMTFLAGWLTVAYFAIANGNWDRLLHPTDSRGRLCGRISKEPNNAYDYTDKPYLVYFDVTKCLLSSLALQACSTPSVCVKSCPDYTWLPGLGYPDSGKICIDGLDETGQDACAPYVIPSSSLSGRCIPFAPQANATSLSEQQVQTRQMLTSAKQNGISDDLAAQITKGREALGVYLNTREIAEKIFQDFRASWWMILVGFLFAMILSFIWIVIMRWVAGPMVWLGLAAIIGVLGYGTAYCFITWNDLRQRGDEPPFEFTFNPDSYLTRQTTWLVFGIIAGIVLAIILLITLFLRNRIRLAVALLREASKGVSSMIMTLFWPVVPFVLQLAVFAAWGILAILLSSAGQTEGVLISRDTGTPLNKTCRPGSTNISDPNNCIFSNYKSGPQYTYFHLYNIFALFWMGFFVVGISDVCLAGAFASYYWTRDKSKNLPVLPLAASVGRCLRYHLGSVAFGSLIIAIVRFVRYLLEQLDQKLRQSQLGFARFLLKCCMCCLWCLEKFLKFINRNAYIMMSIYGKNFCRSARAAFSLLMRNMIRVVVLDKVTDFLLFLGKLVIVSAIGVGAFFFFSGRIPASVVLPLPPRLNFYYIPVITVILGSYLIATVFFDVYAMAVDTMFLCFLEDLERNDGSVNKPYFMSKNLMRILGKKNKQNKKQKKDKTVSSEAL